MPKKSPIALKEWSIVVSALSEGRQVLILKKGGILDPGKKFSADHSAFYLYPTFLHQQRIKKNIEKTQEEPKNTEIIFSSYAVVDECFWASDIEILNQLEHFHILPKEEVEKRFWSGKKPGLYVLILRVYSLSPPPVVQILPHFLGCKSWVDLGNEVSASDRRPILDDELFEQRVKPIKTILDKASKIWIKR